MAAQISFTSAYFEFQWVFTILVSWEIFTRHWEDVLTETNSSFTRIWFLICFVFSLHSHRGWSWWMCWMAFTYLQKRRCNTTHKNAFAKIPNSTSVNWPKLSFKLSNKTPRVTKIPRVEILLAGVYIKSNRISGPLNDSYRIKILLAGV